MRDAEGVNHPTVQKASRFLADWGSAGVASYTVGVSEPISS